MFVKRLEALIKPVLPKCARVWLTTQRDSYRVWRKRKRDPLTDNDWGALRRLTPIGKWAGFERGQPIDRYYIDDFLASHVADIRGQVLEIGDDRYTRRFGGHRVLKSDVLHYVEGNSQATIIADLGRADHVPSDMFDCIIITQTLQCIYEVREAIRDLHRILKPGGSILATCPGISAVWRQLGVDPWGTYFHLTAQSARLLFEEHFPAANVEVRSYGNVLAAVAFLHGLAAHELTREELDYHDPAYEVSIAVRVVKP